MFESQPILQDLLGTSAITPSPTEVPNLWQQSITTSAIFPGQSTICCRKKHQIGRTSDILNIITLLRQDLLGGLQATEWR